MKVYDFDTATACCIYDITLADGTEYHVTDASADVEIPGGDTYSAHPALKSGVKTSRHDGTPSSFGFQAQLLSPSGPFRFQDVDRGKYERARVLMRSTSFVTPTASPVFEFDGEIRGGIQYDPTGVIASFDVTARLAIPRGDGVLVNQFTLPCGWQYGDPLTCRMPVFPYIYGRDLGDVARNETIALGDRRRFRFGSDDTPEDYQNVYLEATDDGVTAGSAPVFSSTVGATVVDGGVTWTTRNARARYGQVVAVDGQRTITLDALPDPRASDSQYFHPAKIMFATGEYKNRVFKGGSWDPDAFTIQTYLPCPFAAVNDWVEIAPACDQTEARCIYLDNIVNHGGFPKHNGGKLQAQQVGYD